VIVTDGRLLLLGHATASPRWDIPKGIAEPGESLVAAAVREVFEETGLQVTESALHDLGVHAYLRDKDLALFCWRPATMPALDTLDTLACSSMFALPSGTLVPEFDRFGLFTWDEALDKVGKNLARVLSNVRTSVVTLQTAGSDV
jgi:8-oxo-dGTP pyrophosphatase MutT (NUDIX family)